MVGELPLEVLESLPCIVQGLPISLIEEGDVGPQLCSFSKQEVFVEECL